MKLINLMMIFLVLILFAVASTSVVTAQNQNQDNKKVEKDDNDDDADDSPEAQRELAKQAKISLEQARQTALQRVSGEILESELDRETGKLVYEFEIRDQSGKIQEVLVDAQTGEIVSVEEENENDDDDDESDSPKMQPELTKEARISVDQARQIALARVPGTVIESELGKEKGKVVYEFEIRDKDNKSFDVLVDAKTGEIVGVEADDEDDSEDTKPKSQAKNDKGKWYAFWRRIPGF